MASFTIFIDLLNFHFSWRKNSSLHLFPSYVQSISWLGPKPDRIPQPKYCYYCTGYLRPPPLSEDWPQRPGSTGPYCSPYCSPCFFSPPLAISSFCSERNLTESSQGGGEVLGEEEWGGITVYLLSQLFYIRLLHRGNNLHHLEISYIWNWQQTPTVFSPFDTW